MEGRRMPSFMPGGEMFFRHGGKMPPLHVRHSMFATAAVGNRLSISGCRRAMVLQLRHAAHEQWQAGGTLGDDERKGSVDIKIACLRIRTFGGEE